MITMAVSLCKYHFDDLDEKLQHSETEVYLKLFNRLLCERSTRQNLFRRSIDDVKLIRSLCCESSQEPEFRKPLLCQTKTMRFQPCLKAKPFIFKLVLFPCKL